MSIFKKVLQLICNKNQFSFAIDKNLAFEMVYNNGAGKCKLMLENEQQSKDFIAMLCAHKNKIAGKISQEFKNLIAPAPTEAMEQPLYRVNFKERIYFDCVTDRLIGFENIEHINTNLRYGFEVLTPLFPDLLILWHKGIGFDVSIVYRGKLFGTSLVEGDRDEKIASFINECEFLGAELFEALETAFIAE